MRGKSHWKEAAARALFLACAFPVCALLGAQPLGNYKEKLETYVDSDAIWRSRTIPVCWEAGSREYATQKVWVQEAVRDWIESNSDVRFAGAKGEGSEWADCGPKDLGIRITVADLHPVSEVGQQWQRDASGKRMTDAAGYYIVRATAMILNFEFAEPAAFYACRDRKQHCIRTIGVHEFLHALGFLHEHLRPDTPDVCKNKFTGYKDFYGYRPMPVGDYDPDSFMNYCRNIYEELRLSEGDLYFLRSYYSNTPQQ